jgi:hypothetical protein
MTTTLVRKFAKQYTYEDKTMGLLEWAEHLSIPSEVLSKAIRRTKTFSEALMWVEGGNAKNPRRRECTKLYAHNGRTMDIFAWAEESGIQHGTLYARIRAGMPFGEAITTPVGIKESNQVYSYKGLTLPISTWEKFIGCTRAGLEGSAGRRGITLQEEIIRRMEANPALFPAHLLEAPVVKVYRNAVDPLHNKYAVKIAAQNKEIAFLKEKIAELQRIIDEIPTK